MNDDLEMASRAESILMNKEIFLANEILAEVVYVLSGVYGILKDEVSDKLVELISFPNINTSNKKIILKSLEIYKTKKLDFVDCLLCAYSQKDEVMTFDKKLNRCIKSENI